MKKVRIQKSEEKDTNHKVKIFSSLGLSCISSSSSSSSVVLVWWVWLVWWLVCSPFKLIRLEFIVVSLSVFLSEFLRLLLLLIDESFALLELDDIDDVPDDAIFFFNEFVFNRASWFGTSAFKNNQNRDLPDLWTDCCWSSYYETVVCD